MSHPTTVRLPREYPNDDEGVLTDWRVADGDRVQAGQTVATAETTKAAIEIVAPAGGFLRYAVVVGDWVAVGGVLGFITDAPDTPVPRIAVPEPAPARTELGGESPGQRITRKAQKLIREHAINPEVFADLPVVELANVERWLAEHSIRAGARDGIATQRLDPARVRLDRALSASQVAASLVSRAISVDTVERALASTRASGTVTVGELFIWAAAQILHRFPDLNAFHSGDAIHRYRDVHIGYVMQMGRALEVPVLSNTDERSLTDVAAATKDFAMRYLRGELGPTDSLGGTFTVSDLYAKGVTFFSPIINVNQAGILGLASPDGGRFQTILAFDHRITDGAYAADFLIALEEQLGLTG